MEPVLALVEETLARPERASELGGEARSPESLASVGRVTIEALDRIMHRLSRIDAFSAGTSPFEVPEEASPELVETAPSS